ncbi:HNH endonuclease [Pseudochelatococcus sp. B33]
MGDALKQEPKLFGFRPRPKTLKVPTGRERRESPRKRGYDSAWDRLSRQYREENPFCEMCDQAGRIRFCDVVDHMYPVADGGPVHDRSNLWSLCYHHHHGWKARAEALARRTGRLHRIAEWCREPDSRPLELK